MAVLGSNTALTSLDVLVPPSLKAVLLPGLGRMTGLQSLTVSCSSPEKACLRVPRELRELTELTELRLSINASSADDLALCLSALHKLEVLHLWHHVVSPGYMSMKTLVEACQGVSSLTRLTLGGRLLASRFRMIGEMTQLRSLDLSSVLPDAVEQTAWLIESLGSLRDLKELAVCLPHASFSMRQLVDVLEAAGTLGSCTRLHMLHPEAATGVFEELSESELCGQLQKLTALRHLQLLSPMMVAVYADMMRELAVTLSNLTHLELGGYALPEEFNHIVVAELPSLKRLEVGGTRDLGLADILPKMRSLQHLSVHPLASLNTGSDLSAVTALTSLDTVSSHAQHVVACYS